MTGITFRQQFEAVFLEGKDPTNPITKDSIVKAADGEYFHQHARTAFKFYSRGFEDGCAEVAFAAEVVPAPKPDHVGPDHDCDSNGPLSDFGEHTCRVCGHVWEFPF